MILYHVRFMDKKEYLLKILEQLEPVRTLASWLKVVVEQWIFWDDVTDALIWVLESGISSTKSEVDKIKMEKWLNALQKMKQMEEECNMQDEKDLEELDNIINSF